MVNLKRIPKHTRDQSARFLIKLALALPDPVAYAVARAVTPIVAHVHPRRDWVPTGIQRALGAELDAEAIRQVVRRYFVHITMTFVEIMRLSEWSRSRVLRSTQILGEEHLRAALAQGKGVLVLTGHLGNWEVAAAAGAARGYPFSLVSKPQRSSFLEERLSASRAAHEIAVVPFDNPRDCYAQLGRGAALCLAIDQRLRNGGIEVPFFGQPARVHSGPATLALRTGVPLLVASQRRVRPGYHVMHVEPMSLVRTGNRRQDIYENTVRFQRALENEIRRCPEQWIWDYRTWRRARPDAGGQSQRETEPAQGRLEGAARPIANPAVEPNFAPG